jgi:hypothetical protein
MRRPIGYLTSTDRRYGPCVTSRGRTGGEGRTQADGFAELLFGMFAGLGNGIPTEATFHLLRIGVHAIQPSPYSRESSDAPPSTPEHGRPRQWHAVVPFHFSDPGKSSNQEPPSEFLRAQAGDTTRRLIAHWNRSATWMASAKARRTASASAREPSRHTTCTPGCARRQASSVSALRSDNTSTRRRFLGVDEHRGVGAASAQGEIVHIQQARNP